MKPLPTKHYYPILGKFKDERGNVYYSVCQYVPPLKVKHSDFCADSAELDGVYCEEDDEFYAPEGFYEYSHVADINWFIDDKLLEYKCLKKN